MARLRSVTEIAPKSPFLCVNRSLVRCGFRAGARAAPYGWNTESVAESHLLEPPFKVARYSFPGPIPPKFEHKLRRHKQSFEKIATTVVLDKDENLL